MKMLRALLGELSGSMGGITASRNRYGPYLRFKGSPVNPNSPRQQVVRAIFAALSNDWSNSLEASERERWVVYAANVAMKDSLGQDVFITGYNMFLRTNVVALLGEVAQINAGPQNFTLADVDETMLATVDEAQQEISVAFDVLRDWVEEDEALMQISMSRPANVGIIYIPPVNRVAGYLLGNNSTPLTSPQVLDVPFPVGETNQVIVTGRILRADGRLGNGFQVTSSVTA